jgi:hypothetical protein
MVVVREKGGMQRIVLSGTYCWSHADCRPAGRFLLHLSAFFCCWPEDIDGLRDGSSVLVWLLNGFLGTR